MALHTQKKNLFCSTVYFSTYVYSGVLRSYQFIKNGKVEDFRMHFRMCGKEQLTWNKIGELLNHWFASNSMHKAVYKNILNTQGLTWIMTTIITQTPMFSIAIVPFSSAYFHFAYIWCTQLFCPDEGFCSVTDTISNRYLYPNSSHIVTNDKDYLH